MNTGIANWTAGRRRPSMRIVATTSARAHTLVRLTTMVLAIADRAARVDGVVDGDHDWRQAHVLANVDKMLANGVFATPSTFNSDLFLHFYDAPVWQALVALASRTTGIAPAPLAEAMNVAVFAMTVAVTWWLVRLLALSRLAGTLALLFLALAPLSRFYAATSLLDPFVSLLAVVSWACWLRSRPSSPASGARRAAVAALLTAWLATFVKCPIYLPVAATIVITTVQEHGWRGLSRPLVIAWAAGLGAALAAFRLLTVAANADADGWPDLATELAWYFGDASERTTWSAHVSIVKSLAKHVVAWPALALAIGGLCARRHEPGERRAIVHALAALATALLFLHVNLEHNYYQLPCVVPLALVAGAGCASAWQRLSTSPQRTLRALAVVLAVGVAAFAAIDSQRRLAKLTALDTSAWRAAGTFVAAHTNANDFVLFGTPARDDNPAFLWSAHRDGANVIADRLAAALTRWRPRAEARGGRLVAFVPATTPAVAAACRTDAHWRELASGAPGVLFESVR